MTRFVLWAFVVMAVVRPPVLWAQDSSADTEARIHALIDQLGDRDFQQRERAQRELLTYGAAAREQLAANVNHPDLEVAGRVTQLLQSIVIVSEARWQPALVTCPQATRPVTVILADLGTQIGANILICTSADSFTDVDTAFACARLPFWRAVDDLCRAAHRRLHIYRQADQTVAFTLFNDGGERCPTAYAGPFRCRLLTAHREFREHLRYADDSSSLGHTLAISCDLTWEPNFPLSLRSPRPHVAAAITSEGHELLQMSTPAPGSSPMRCLEEISVNEQFQLQPSPATVEVLSRLALTWQFEAIAEWGVLEATNCTAASVYRQDDVTVTIEKFSSRQPGQCDVVVQFARANYADGRPDDSDRENTFELVDDAGLAWKQATCRHEWTGHDHKYSIGFRYVGPADVGQALVLRCTYPRLRATREICFEFRDVPLPRQIP